MYLVNIYWVPVVPSTIPGTEYTAMHKTDLSSCLLGAYNLVWGDEAEK